MVRMGMAIVKGCRPLTDAEIERTLLSFAGRHAARDRALFTLGLLSGFRISELLSLTVGDVQVEGRFPRWITVRRSNMKGNRESRSAPFHPAAQKAIAAWLAEVGEPEPEQPLFASQKRQRDRAARPISRIQAGRVLRRGFRLAGVLGQTGTHSMRKTYAHKVHRASGGDILTTQRLLGHRNLNSTAQYLASMPEDDLEGLVGALSIGRPGPLFERPA